MVFIGMARLQSGMYQAKTHMIVVFMQLLFMIPHSMLYRLLYKNQAITMYIVIGVHKLLLFLVVSLSLQFQLLGRYQEKEEGGKERSQMAQM